MYKIQHNPARLYNCDETGITILQHKHKNISFESQSSDIFCSVRRMEISCDIRQMYESNWIMHSSVTCIPKKMYKTRTDEWYTTWINPRVPSLGVDTERDFHPVVFSFNETYKADKKILLSRYRMGTIHTQGTPRS